jgi:GTPase SAR1 family protein
LQNWLGQAKEFAKDNVQIALLGNKIDLAGQRKVKFDEAKRESFELVKSED